VDQQVHRRQAKPLNPALEEVGLIFNAVIVVGGLVRKAEAQHIQGEHVVLLNQHRPEAIPVPTGGRKPVNEDQWFSRTRHPTENGMPLETEPLTSLLPPFQGAFLAPCGGNPTDGGHQLFHVLSPANIHRLKL